MIREELGKGKWFSLWFDPSLGPVLDKSRRPTWKNTSSGCLRFCADGRAPRGEHDGRAAGALLAWRCWSTWPSPSTPCSSPSTRNWKRPPTPARARRCRSALCLRRDQPQVQPGAVGGRAAPAGHLPARVKWSWTTAPAPTMPSPTPASWAGQRAVRQRDCAPVLQPAAPAAVGGHDLMTSLARHLKPVIHRIRYNLPIVNHNADEVGTPSRRCTARPGPRCG